MNIAISTAIDLLLIAVFVISIVIVAKKGFVKAVIGLFGNVIAAVVAFCFSGALGTYITSNFLYNPMRQWMINLLSPTAEKTTANIVNLNFDELFTDMPKFFSDILKSLNLDGNYLAQTYSSMKASGQSEAKSAVIDLMISPTAEILGRVIAFVLIFVLSVIAIHLLVWLIDFIVKLPVLRQINKIGGIILGVLNGILFVCIVAGILSVSLGYILPNKTTQDIEEISENAKIYNTVNSINPVKYIFDGWK